MGRIQPNHAVKRIHYTPYPSGKAIDCVSSRLAPMQLLQTAASTSTPVSENHHDASLPGRISSPERQVYQSREAANTPAAGRHIGSSDELEELGSRLSAGLRTSRGLLRRPATLSHRTSSLRQKNNSRRYGAAFLAARASLAVKQPSRDTFQRHWPVGPQPGKIRRTQRRVRNSDMGSAGQRGWGNAPLPLLCGI